jgi:hypothetical protein
MGCQQSTDPLGRCELLGLAKGGGVGERRQGCCLSAWTGPKPTTRSACSTRPAPCWAAGGYRMGSLASPSCTRWSLTTPASRPRWWSASSWTGGCWSGPWWRPATRWWRSTPWPPAATGNATAPRGPSRTPVTPRCWPTWSAPTATTIAWSAVIATWSRPSGCWPGPISRPSGAANASSTASGRPCGPSTRPRWRPSAPTWPPEMPWRCSSWRQPPSGAASCPEPSSPRPGSRRPPPQPPRSGSPDPGRVALPQLTTPSRSARPTGR